MSLLKADTIKPVTSGGDLSLQGDSGGSAVDCLNITSAGDINFTGNTDAKIKLPSAGGIYESDGSTAILTESGGAVTLDNVAIGSSVTGLPGAGLTHIKTITASGVTNVAFVNGTASVVLNSTYEIYKIFGSNITVTTDGTYLSCSLSTNAGVGYTDATGGGISGGGSAGGVAGAGSFYAATGGFIEPGFGIGNASGKSVSFEMTIYNPAGTSVDVVIHVSTAYSASNANLISGTWMLRSPFTNADVDAIKINVPAGNISGIFQLYGVKSS